MKFRKPYTVTRPEAEQSDNTHRYIAHLMAAITAFGSGVGVNLGTAWAMDETRNIIGETSPELLGHQSESKTDGEPVNPIPVDQMKKEQALPDASAFKSRRGDDEAPELRLSPGTTELKR